MGRDVILDQIRLIELAEKSANIKRFFPSEYGTDIEYGPNSEHERPHQAKLKVRTSSTIKTGLPVRSCNRLAQGTAIHQRKHQES